MNSIETLDYKGYSINVYYDDSPENPFEDWGCEPDLIALVPGYGGSSELVSYGNIDADYLPELNRAHITANIPDILDQTGYSSLLGLVRDCAGMYLRHYVKGSEAVNDALQCYYDTLNNSDKLEFLAFIYNDVLGIPALCASVHGFSQGDYGEILVVASPKFVQRTGSKIDNPEQLRGAVELYESWAFGSVYGYVIEDSESDSIDSCWGFYGFDHDKSGLLDSAKEAIDYHVMGNQ